VGNTSLAELGAETKKEFVKFFSWRRMFFQFKEFVNKKNVFLNKIFLQKGF